MNELLIISGLLGAAYMLRKNKSISGIGRTWYGGNSGYQGYSMSKRAVEAREEGIYPKTDFKKVYGINDATLNALVELNVISNNEWHHTSKYGNKTKFYSWIDDDYIALFEESKKEIQALIKNKQYAEVADIFNVPYNGDYDTADVQVGDRLQSKNYENITGKVISVGPKYITIEKTELFPNGKGHTYTIQEPRNFFNKEWIELL